MNFYYSYETSPGKFSMKVVDDAGNIIWQSIHPAFITDSLTGQLIPDETPVELGVISDLDNISALENHLKKSSLIEFSDSLLFATDKKEEDGIVDNENGTVTYKGFIIKKWVSPTTGNIRYTSTDDFEYESSLNREERDKKREVISELNIIEDKKTSEQQTAENSRKPIHYRYADFPKSKFGEGKTIRNYLDAVKERIRRGEVIDEGTKRDYERYLAVAKQNKWIDDKFEEGGNLKSLTDKIKYISEKTGIKFKKSNNTNSWYGATNDGRAVRISDHPSKFVERGKTQGVEAIDLNLEYFHPDAIVHLLLEENPFAGYKEGDNITHSYDKVGDVTYLNSDYKKGFVEVKTKDDRVVKYNMDKFLGKNYASKMAKGGKLTPVKKEKLIKAVAKQYEGKKVKPEYQEKYGKRYSKKEAKSVAYAVANTVEKMKEQNKKPVKKKDYNSLLKGY